MPGRAEPVADAPLTVYDGAHNPAGAHVMAESLDEVLGARRPRVAVIGVLEDKDAAAMLAELLGEFDQVVFTRSRNPRSLSPATLACGWSLPSTLTSISRASMPCSTTIRRS